MSRSDQSTKGAGRGLKNKGRRTGITRVTAERAVPGEQGAGTEAISADPFAPPYQDAFEGGPWGNRANLSLQPLPGFLRKEAEALRESQVLDFRLTRLALLIVKARMHGFLSLEDEIIESAGFTSAQFWLLYIPRQCAPEKYAVALARMMADPADRHMAGTVLPIVPGNEAPRHDSMAPILWQLYRALRRAYEEREPWFVRVRPVSQAVTIQDQSKPQRTRLRPAVEVLTDDAGRYIAANLRTRELLHSSYLAALEAGGHSQPYPAERVVIGEQKSPAGSAADAVNSQSDAEPAPIPQPTIPKKRKSAPKARALLVWYDALPTNIRRQSPHQLAKKYNDDHPAKDGKDQARYARQVFGNPNDYRER